MRRSMVVAGLIAATLTCGQAQAGDKLGAVLGGAALGTVGGVLLGSALANANRPPPASRIALQSLACIRPATADVCVSSTMIAAREIVLRRIIAEPTFEAAALSFGERITLTSRTRSASSCTALDGTRAKLRHPPPWG